MPSLAKCLFRSSAHVLIGLLVVFVCVSLYVFVGFFDIELYELFILEINPLLVASIANIFSHSVDCVFVLFMVSLKSFALTCYLLESLLNFSSP